MQNILNKKIKEVMQQLPSWFYLNKVVINTEKTIAISFHAWQNKSNLNLKLYFKILTLNIRMKQNF
jgi:stage III sporulation protein SpoIIIAA